MSTLDTDALRTAVLADAPCLFGFDDYQTLSGQTATYAVGDTQDVFYAALGLASEAGEVAGQVKRMIRDDGSRLTEDRREKILDELGDCLWYVAALAGDLGETLENVARRNVRKLHARRLRGTIRGEGDGDGR